MHFTRSCAAPRCAAMALAALLLCMAAATAEAMMPGHTPWKPAKPALLHSSTARSLQQTTQQPAMPAPAKQPARPADEAVPSYADCLGYWEAELERFADLPEEEQSSTCGNVCSYIGAMRGLTCLQGARCTMHCVPVEAGQALYDPVLALAVDCSTCHAAWLQVACTAIAHAAWPAAHGTPRIEAISLCTHGSQGALRLALSSLAAPCS